MSQSDSAALVLTLEEAMRMNALNGEYPFVDVWVNAEGEWWTKSLGAPKQQHAGWPEAYSVAFGRPVVARDEAAELLPVGDSLTAYNDLLGEWEHRKRTYGKYEARHPVRLREAVREADGAGLVLAGDAIQSLVHEAAVEYVRADQLMQDHLRGVAAARDEAAEELDVVRVEAAMHVASARAEAAELRAELDEFRTAIKNYIAARTAAFIFPTAATTNEAFEAYVATSLRLRHLAGEGSE